MEKTKDSVQDIDAAKLPSIPPPVARYPPMSNHGSVTSITSETDSESRFGLSKKEIERLGRIRPEAFESSWSEVGFVLSICMAQILTVCGTPYSSKKALIPHTITSGIPCLPQTAYINRRKDISLPCIRIVTFFSTRGHWLTLTACRNIFSLASTCSCHQ